MVLVVFYRPAAINTIFVVIGVVVIFVVMAAGSSLPVLRPQAA